MACVQRVFTGFIVLLFAGGALAQERPADEPAVRAVAQALPAVVNINTERVVRRLVQDPYDAFFYEFFGGPVRPPRQLAQTVQSLGSGFLISADGYIVTNEHVVERAADLKIQVTLSDGRTLDARYVTGDTGTDLALIKIDGEKPFPFIDMAELSPNLLGQTVLVLGNPVGYGSSVSRGILSATQRTVSVGAAEYRDLLQTDAAINPGNSGGPVIDIAGKLVGLSSVKMAYTPQGVPTQGIGFAIAADTVRERVGEFRKEAEAQARAKAIGVQLSKRLFGFQVQDLTPALVEALGFEPGGGVLVSDVERGSPAERAGLDRGLVIYRVGRYEVAGSTELEKLLEQARTGARVDFVVGALRRVGGRVVQEVRTISVTAR